MSINQIAIAYLVASVFFYTITSGSELSFVSQKRKFVWRHWDVYSSWCDFAFDKELGTYSVSNCSGRFYRHHNSAQIEMTQMPELVAAMHS